MIGALVCPVTTTADIAVSANTTTNAIKTTFFNIIGLLRASAHRAMCSQLHLASQKDRAEVCKLRTQNGHKTDRIKNACKIADVLSLSKKKSG
jgi:hypothetical protein